MLGANHSSNDKARWNPGRLRIRVAEKINAALAATTGSEKMHVDPGCIECMNGLTALNDDTPSWHVHVADGRYSSGCEIYSYSTLTEISRGAIRLVEDDEINGWWAEPVNTTTEGDGA